MQKTRTISVVIPAFNEQYTIGKLLKSIHSQKGNFILEKIYVLLDGSTDNTVTEVKKLDYKNIELIVKDDRQGKSARMQELLKIPRSDIIISCDADIYIKNNRLFEKIVTSFKDFNGLASVKNTPIRAENFIEKSLKTSVDLKNLMKRLWNNGNNYLSFSGMFLVYSQEFAHQLSIPGGLVNDDAYIYFKAKELGYTPKYFSNLEAFYTLPSNFQDHFFQASRFKTSFNELRQYLKLEKSEEYIIPLYTIFIALITTFVKNPLYFVGYVAIYATTQIRKRKVSPLWKTALSTKGGKYVW